VSISYWVPEMLRKLAVCILAAMLVACVSQERYDAALKSAQQAADAQAKRLSDDIQTARAQIEQLNEAIKKAQAHAADQDRALVAAQATTRDLQAKVDAATAENEQLRKELTRLGKNADSLLSEKGSLSTALADAKARLDELRRAQEAAEARARQFKQLVAKFQRMIDAGQLKVALRNGRMVIQLANDVLFDSGRTDIKPAGQDAIKQVAVVLKTIPDRHFQVAGDTDNLPIQTALFPSNWELSTRRAVEVVRFLVAQGLRPEALSAAGYGEFDRIAPNDSPQGRQKNRRIEITLEPNINELVSAPTTP
jgi:chemotaxis protein MotB